MFGLVKHCIVGPMFLTHFGLLGFLLMHFVINMQFNTTHLYNLAKPFLSCASEEIVGSSSCLPGFVFAEHLLKLYYSSSSNTADTLEFFCFCHFSSSRSHI